MHTRGMTLWHYGIPSDAFDASKNRRLAMLTSVYQLSLHSYNYIPGISQRTIALIPSCLLQQDDSCRLIVPHTAERPWRTDL
jgi:hypothetical protein